MMKEAVQLIPIAEIAIPNPRARNKIIFDGIVASIRAVGLKKPITISRKSSSEDGFRYNLICGQGRLEAFLALGETAIPAIIREIPGEDCYLHSLIENIARRPPKNTGLLEEVQALQKRGYKTDQIAQKLGMNRPYIYGIVSLLNHGEVGLLKSVEARRIPISVAVSIASGSDADMQRALSEAYEKGELRGSKLETAKRMMARRLEKRKDGKVRASAEIKLSSAVLVREYERYTKQQRALVSRAALANRRMLLLASAMKKLMEDENFVTLLRAESLVTMPQRLAAHMA